MNIKPGDLFQWVYRRDNKPARQYEKLFSHSMGKHVSCSGVCLCVGINNDIIYWVSSKVLLQARITLGPPTPMATWWIIPQRIQS